VRTNLPGASPEEVESLVTQQIEEVVNTVDGIDELRSISGQKSFCDRHFNWIAISNPPQDVRGPRQSWPEFAGRCYSSVVQKFDMTALRL